MKQLLLILILFIAPLITNVSAVYAQEDADEYGMTIQDYTSITLPPLQELYTNALQGTTYQLATARVEIEKKLVAKEKRNFLSYFSLRGSYQYGMFGNESTYTDVSIAPYLTYTTQAQNGYTVGAGINIPVDAIFDAKARVKRQKLAQKVAELEREKEYEGVKKEIIQMYSMCKSQLNILKLRAESLELTELQYKISENDFVNGAISTSDLSTDKQRQTDALEAFETSRNELTKSILILELISNTKILGTH